MEELREAFGRGRWKTRHLINQAGEVVQKECRSCKIMKPLDDFYPADDCLAKRRSECKDCELPKNRHYHRSDKKRTAARKSKWREANRERHLQTLRAWYNKNKDSINEKRRPNGRILNKRRRDRLAKLLRNWSKEDKESAMEYFKGCALTGSTKDIVFDHVIPLCTEHAGTVVWNMLPMTSELNLSKSTKHVVEWFYANQERFGLNEDRFLDALQYLADRAEMDLDDYLSYIDWCHENKPQGEKQ